MDKTASQSKVLDRLELFKLLPMGQYEYVDVSFTAADTDTVIHYNIIKPEDPNSVRWIDVTPNSGKIYRAVNPNKKNWEYGYVILRSTTIGSTRLLLFLERE